MSKTPIEPSTLETLETELRNAMRVTKCHRCGCFQNAVLSFEKSPVLKSRLRGVLEEARSLFQHKRYDCLGCEICWPAVASNAAAELDPMLAEETFCATEEPVLREGWPPLPGDYRVLRFQAPVAVVTLNSDDLMEWLVLTRPPGMAIVGTLRTENLGIERIIRNLLPNPNVRFLVVCGVDTQKAIGHLPGHSLVSLMREGLDDSGRICGAAGKRPVIKNVSREHVEAFRRRIEVINLIGETDVDVIVATIAEAAGRDPGAATESLSDAMQIAIENAVEPERLVIDPAGYLVIYPDRLRGLLVLEHYANNGVLTRVLEGKTPAALSGTAIEAGLISRLDHAAYLGRELARAEATLIDGTEYVQDKAPGKCEEENLSAPVSACCCPTNCG